MRRCRIQAAHHEKFRTPDHAQSEHCPEGQRPKQRDNPEGRKGTAILLDVKDGVIGKERGPRASGRLMTTDGDPIKNNTEAASPGNVGRSSTGRFRKGVLIIWIMVAIAIVTSRRHPLSEN